MSFVKISKKYQIPEYFPSFLHDYIREVLRNDPQDIINFSIDYFSELDGTKNNNIPSVSNNNIEHAENTDNIDTNKLIDDYINNENNKNPDINENMQSINNNLSLSQSKANSIKDDNQNDQKGLSIKVDFNKTGDINYNGDTMYACKSEVNQAFDNYYNTNENNPKTNTIYSDKSCYQECKMEVDSYFKDAYEGLHKNNEENVNNDNNDNV